MIASLSRLVRHVAWALLLAGGVGCARSRPDAETPLVVFAAASLRESFTALREGFVEAHPEARVEFSFAGSQELRAQLERGARADVFAAADEASTAALASKGLVDAPVVFAENEPVVVVRAPLRASVRTLADLPRASRIVLGVPDAPIGRYADDILRKMAQLHRGVEAHVISREFNTRQVLAKMRLGEADAAIVYRTDARVAPELFVVDIPPDVRPAARCTMAVTSSRPHALAEAWRRFALSAAGQRILTHSGLVASSGPR